LLASIVASSLGSLGVESAWLVARVVQFREAAVGRTEPGGLALADAVLDPSDFGGHEGFAIGIEL
jgi:hypothetical protein